MLQYKNKIILLNNLDVSWLGRRLRDAVPVADIAASMLFMKILGLICVPGQRQMLLQPLSRDTVWTNQCSYLYDQ